MKNLITILGSVLILSACGERTDTREHETIDTTQTPAGNAYDLPGTDTAAIHQNTSTPGDLDPQQQTDTLR